MSLRERFGDWIAGKRAATEPIAFHPTPQSFFGQGVGNQPSDDDLLRESLGVADMATRAIANRVSTLIPQVETEQTVESGTTERIVLDDHPLKALLDRPHPNFTRAALLRLTSQWLVTVGKAYWLKVGNRLNLPAELHPIPPQNCFPLLEQGVISGYSVLNGDGERFTLPPDVVVRFNFADPEDPWGSEGYLGPAGTVADSLNFAGQHLRTHYQNDATPKTFFETDENAVPFTGDEKDAFYADWSARYNARVGRNVGQPGIGPNGYKLIQLAFQSGADIVPLLEHWRDEQLMGFGVPRSILGQVVSGDRSSAETNQFVFDLHTITPVAQVISDSLTLQLAPDFSDDIFVEFADFVSSDKVHDLAREAQDLEKKVLTVNEVRTNRGLEEVDYGEEPIGTLADSPYRPDEEFEGDPDNPFALGGGSDEEPEEDEDEDERTRAVGTHIRAEWKRQVLRERRFTPKFTAAMRRVFAVQRRETLRRLFAQRKRIVPDEIFTEEVWADLFADQLDALRTLAFREIAIETLGVLPTDAEFFFTAEMAARLESDAARLVRGVNHTTRNLLATQLAQATEAGESVDQVAKRVRSVFATRRKHARTIARTELLRASQDAQNTAFRISGVVESKQWNTSLDSSVRDTHALTNGQTVPVGLPFTLGDGERSDGPGLGHGGVPLSAGNAINCRCFLTPVLP